MHARRPKQTLIGPLVLLSAVLVAVLAVALIGLIRGFDLESRQREEALVANGMADRVTEIAALVIPQAVWGDAVRNLDNRFDPAWAQDNVLTFLTETGGFDTIFVIDERDRVLISGTGGARVDNQLFADFAKSAAKLIAAVRAEEVKRGSLQKLPNGRVLKAPIQSNAIISAAGQPYVLTATRVQPDFGDVSLRGRHGPIILAAMRIDQPFLDQFSKRYLLDHLRLATATNPPAKGAAVTALPDPDGMIVARLSWQPQNPGAALFKRLALALGTAGALLVALAVRLIGQSHRTAQGLINSQAQAAHLAYHDSLTGLANRLQFNDQLTEALATLDHPHGSLTVLCIDLDRFKEINDTFGHGAGDDLLIEAAQRMASACTPDDVLARLSGDEFAIIRRGGSQTAASTLAEQLVQQISLPFASGTTQLHVGCSIGIAIANNRKLDPAEILRRADIALYRAKESGRGRYCYFEPEMDVAIKTRSAMEADLRDALAAQKLSLVYQPQASISGEITGLEALIRWTHPVLGEIGPGYFVPIAEQCGLIGQLGMFALRQAFIDSKRWPEMPLAINISSNQLRDRDFLPQLIALVAELGVDPARFELEITEGILLADDPDTRRRLADLAVMGFGLALDDFGTGYSSLGYLHRYPISKIKIDRSFIANLGIESEADAVVDAIIKLARALNLKVIAEGVETMDQLRLLAAAGCPEIQGYLLSRPVTADVMDRMLEGAPVLLTDQGEATAEQRKIA